MPKTDNGFQGIRPAVHGPTWDAMTSPQRRRAFWGDVALCVGGVALLLGLMGACVPSQAQERIVGRDGRTLGYVERGSRDQSRIIGRDGRTRAYLDGSTGRIQGRDGRTRGYVIRDR